MDDKKNREISVRSLTNISRRNELSFFPLLSNLWVYRLEFNGDLSATLLADKQGLHGRSSNFHGSPKRFVIYIRREAPSALLWSMKRDIATSAAGRIIAMGITMRVKWIAMISICLVRTPVP